MLPVSETKSEIRAPLPSVIPPVLFNSPVVLSVPPLIVTCPLLVIDPALTLAENSTLLSTVNAATSPLPDTSPPDEKSASSELAGARVPVLSGSVTSIHWLGSLNAPLPPFHENWAITHPRSGQCEVGSGVHGKTG